MTCGDCGPDDGILEVRFDLDAVRAAWQQEPLAARALNHWRYRELLPLEPQSIPNHWPVGWTPVLDLPRLARELGVAQLLVKDEGRNPTASLKDRASSVGVAHALEQRATTIACASTGNAATSLSGHAALAGLPAVIFVPQNAAVPKLAQLLVYGACVFTVAGPYERAYQLCSEACAEFGWYNRNCAINPVLVEGKKTCGLEIAEQCAAAAALAGVEEAIRQKTIGPKDRVLAVVTGSGLKDTVSAIKAAGQPIALQEPSLDAVAAGLKSFNHNKKKD
jgi:threonine synthase